MRLNTENLPEQLRAAIHVGKAAANRSLLAEISPEEYSRLLKAAGEVILPDQRETTVRQSPDTTTQSGKIATSTSGSQPDGHSGNAHAARRIYSQSLTSPGHPTARGPK